MSFWRRRNAAKSPVKTIHSAVVQQRGAVLRFDFHADAFLHHMIRNIVGALVYIGSGRQPSGWLRELIAQRDHRWRRRPSRLPDGLYPLELSTIASINRNSEFWFQFVDTSLLPREPALRRRVLVRN